MYIDYNNDGSLAPGELLLAGTTASGTSQTFTTNILIPVTATTGTMLRMRVVADANGFTTPCGNHFIGDTEDYGVYLSPPVVLPIELISFDANTVGDHVHLTWVTASEDNNDYFAIERSINGNVWEEVAVVDGAGYSAQLLDYSSRDVSPYLGRSYYRLRQTDFDGNFTFSELRIITIDSELEVSAYPNPFNDQLKLSVYSDRSGQVSLQVMNLIGQVVKRKVIDLVGGDNVIGLDLAHVKNGAYLIQLNVDETQNKFVRVLKQ